MTHFILGRAPFSSSRTLTIPFAAYTPSIDQVNQRWHKTRQAVAHPSLIAAQLEWCNAVYIHGGDTLRLIGEMRKAPVDWKRSLEGKTVYAISAGVSALTSISYNSDWNQVVYGLGVLPYKSIVHYRKQDSWKVKALLHLKPNLPLLLLCDGMEVRIWN